MNVVLNYSEHRGWQLEIFELTRDPTEVELQCGCFDCCVEGALFLEKLCKNQLLVTPLAIGLHQVSEVLQCIYNGHILEMNELGVLSM